MKHSCSGGYDTDAFRAFLKSQKIRPVIRGKSNREKRILHARKAYGTALSSRGFGRRKDFRRIATRYDKLAQASFLRCASLRVVTILAYWL